MTVKGQQQGDIKGDVTLKGKEGTIQVLAFSHQVISPRDAASGLPIGKRQHSPLIITKKIDKSTPLLMNALVNNENLPTLTLRFYRPITSGAEQQYYTIKLTNAAVSSIKQYMVYSETTGLTGYHLEEVSFTYQKIEWIIEDGGITAEDDWETPVA
jgi:type VI secretion system secreted protein Hcp